MKDKYFFLMFISLFLVCVAISLLNDQISWTTQWILKMLGINDGWDAAGGWVSDLGPIIVVAEVFIVVATLPFALFTFLTRSTNRHKLLQLRKWCITVAMPLLLLANFIGLTMTYGVLQQRYDDLAPRRELLADLARLNDSDSSVRREAAIALGKLNDAKAVEPLIACLNDPESSVRSVAADALGDLKDTKAVEPLIAHLKDSNSIVRFAAADALGNLNDAKAVEPLIACLVDTNSLVWEAAENALDKITDTYPLLNEFARKASEKVDECKALGDRQIIRYKTVLVWEMWRNQKDPAQKLLDRFMKYPNSNNPVTVFLVGSQQTEQVGTYSISRQPAYREWVDVYVVQFRDLTDNGTPIAAHKVVSLDPAEERPVQNTPEFGDPAPSVASWINSLPVK
jgi:HEAT repeats